MPKRKIISYDDDGGIIEEDGLDLHNKRSRYDDEFVKRIAAFNDNTQTPSVIVENPSSDIEFNSWSDSCDNETTSENLTQQTSDSDKRKYPDDLDNEADMPQFWSLADGLGNVDTESEDEDSLNIMKATPSVSFVSTEIKFGIELANLCNRANVPLYLYDQFAQLTKKYMSNKTMKPNMIPSREKLMKVLYEKIEINPPKMVPVGENGEYLSLYIFREQLHDLMSSELFRQPGALCVNTDEDNIFGKYVSSENEGITDLPLADWYQQTHDKCIGSNLVYKEPKSGIEYKNWLVPLIFYTDKTGTGSSMEGTYSLEPFVFTLGIIRMDYREKAEAWRHLGFVPPCNNPKSNSESNLQFYHDCLSIMFQDITKCQKEPLLCSLEIGGTVHHVRIIIEVAFVIGDQLSQDHLCGRRLVHSGAGRIHRGCFTSYMNAATTPPKEGCFRIPKKIYDQLIHIILEWDDEDTRLKRFETCQDQLSSSDRPISNNQLSSILRFRAQLARDILEKVYSLHPIRNAFNKLSFGCNEDGIHRATLDDPMHFNSSGLFFYLAQVTFHGLLPKDCESVENSMRRDASKRSSVRYDLPRSSYRKGFSNVTMLTASEKVGIMHFLYCMLSTEEVQKIFEKNIMRQQKKYLGCTDSNGLSEDSCKQSYSKIWDQHFFKKTQTKDGKSVSMIRSQSEVKSLLTILNNLGLLSIIAPSLLHFDTLHIEYILQATFERRRTHLSVLKKVEQNILDFVTLEQLSQYTSYFYKNLKKHNKRHCQECDVPVSVQSHIQKHWFDKPRESGTGDTSAILTDVKGFRDVLADALSYYGLVHEYHNLPSDIQTNFPFLERRIREIMSRILSSIYRGDNSLDVLTCKCHSHFHLIEDIKMFGPPMGFDAGKGERHLKTNAKQPSKTARKSGIKEFMDQTSKRVTDRIVLQRALQFLPIRPDDIISSDNRKKISRIRPNATDSCIWEYTRRLPHMFYDLRTGGVKGNYHYPFRLLTDHIRKTLCHLHGEEGSISIWREIRLNLSNHEGHQYVRSFFEFDKYGPYFDWVHVTWNQRGKLEDTYKPAKVLLIYQTEDKCGRALVWSALSATTKDYNHETNISALWQMETEENTGLPQIRSIPLSRIERCCMVHELWQTKEGNQIPTTRNPKLYNKRNPYIIQECYTRYSWSLNLSDPTRWD